MWNGVIRNFVQNHVVPDKHAIIRAALAVLEAQLETLTLAAQKTRAAATHEESRPENDKDTRGLEASYLARGQARRAEETREQLQVLKFMDLRPYKPDDEVGLGAWVALCDESGPDDSANNPSTRQFLIAPVAGGLRVSTGQNPVQLLTPASPLGRALIGKVEGDEVTLAGKSWVVVQIR